ncbi:lysophosphatidylserine lipase ABHD12-like [Sitophilus oryzae]|uniref:Lysophosphatidylserine lipase ABHD12-like n=1 Tax=Sitophilus oryzae TaxID=7048 RepID=A0A6J2YCU5_SITOR|nr:lysophosphatidylserine lipase ABHD12-like [Sitophilus oryzae]
MRMYKKLYAGCLTTTLASTFVAFSIIWIIIPLSFRWSLPFQTFMVFIPIESPRNPQFSQPEEVYSIQGVQNFYKTVHDEPRNAQTSIGMWLILHEDDITNTLSVEDVISDSSRDILIYLHGVYANRAKPLHQYSVFRKYFLVIAIDHRGYGDSGGNVDMTETGIVRDHVQLYNWVRSLNPTVDIYYWGHSLGTALTTHTLKVLKEEQNVVPKGLILESPFTSMEDVIRNIVFGKIFEWLAYFESTILQPLRDNQLVFLSYQHITSIDCPIMILHAEDDSVVPYKLGVLLAEIANKTRTANQGDVVFHGFSDDLGHGHDDITRNPGIYRMIEEFKDACEQFGSQ